MTALEIASEIFNALATQTQTLIDQLAARDYASATNTAYSLLGNINAGAATLRHEAGVAADDAKNELQARVAAAKEQLANRPPLVPPPTEELPEEPPPTEEEEVPPPEVDQPDGGVGDPAPKSKSKK